MVVEHREPGRILGVPELPKGYRASSHVEARWRDRAGRRTCGTRRRPCWRATCGRAPTGFVRNAIRNASSSSDRSDSTSEPRRSAPSPTTPRDAYPALQDVLLRRGFIASSVGAFAIPRHSPLTQALAAVAPVWASVDERPPDGRRAGGSRASRANRSDAATTAVIGTRWQDVRAAGPCA
ncbi:hypothetical protein RHA1_ro06699 [Rhodococcus jostii RHA1]|uniref:Uncharacterized protein n=1 Tax=Rhodococcus jostii (strain RHA1) TaxID=101510 RepID=Q0S1W4_RHOJR|nr:hypothetical protein RHA1_ro06699 [Rhodococcus jostii RHA1]